MKHLLVLQHATCETPGTIADALPGFTLETIRADLGQPVPRDLADEVRQAGADSRAILAGAAEHLPALRAIAATVFGAWARLL